MSKYAENYSLIDWSKEIPAPVKKAHGMKRPMGVISDDLGQPMINHANGKTYESKSEFRKATKAANCIEVGNEVQRDRREWKDGDTRPDIARAISELGG